MNVFADQITIGYVLGTLSAVAVFIVAVVVSVLGFRHAFRGENYSPEGGLFWGVGGAIVALATVIIWLFCSWPLKHDYHYWVDKSGKISQVSKRIVPAGSEGGIQERIVVVIGGQPYGIDDTRATLLKAGDNVKLRCKKSNEWGTPQEAHGWVCKWNQGPLS